MRFLVVGVRLQTEPIENQKDPISLNRNPEFDSLRLAILKIP
jgi:hypothetical protein